MSITTGNNVYSVGDNGVVADARDIRLALVVHGPPRPQRRPHFRSTRSGGFRVFSPSVRQRNFLSGAIRGALSHGGRVYFGRDIPLKMKLLFFMPRPLSHFVGGVRRVDCLREQFESNMSHNLKPDLDNLAKFVMDSLIGIAYEDDCQVYKLRLSKVYDNERECKGRIAIDIKPDVIDLTH